MSAATAKERGDRAEPFQAEPPRPLMRELAPATPFPVEARRAVQPVSLGRSLGR